MTVAAWTSTALYSVQISYRYLTLISVSVQVVLEYLAIGWLDDFVCHLAAPISLSRFGLRLLCRIHASALRYL